MSMADDILEGIFCELCGQYIDDEPCGYPRQCEDCEPPKKKKKPKRLTELERKQK